MVNNRAQFSDTFVWQRPVEVDGETQFVGREEPIYPFRVVIERQRGRDDGTQELLLRLDLTEFGRLLRDKDASEAVVLVEECCVEYPDDFDSEAADELLGELQSVISGNLNPTPIRCEGGEMSVHDVWGAEYHDDPCARVEATVDLDNESFAIKTGANSAEVIGDGNEGDTQTYGPKGEEPYEIDVSSVEKFEFELLANAGEHGDTADSPTDAGFGGDGAHTTGTLDVADVNTLDLYVADEEFSEFNGGSGTSAVLSSGWGAGTTHITDGDNIYAIANGGGGGGAYGSAGSLSPGGGDQDTAYGGGGGAVGGAGGDASAPDDQQDGSPGETTTLATDLGGDGGDASFDDFADDGDPGGADFDSTFVTNATTTEGGSNRSFNDGGEATLTILESGLTAPENLAAEVSAQ